MRWYLVLGGAAENWRSGDSWNLVEAHSPTDALRALSSGGVSTEPGSSLVGELDPEDLTEVVASITFEVVGRPAPIRPDPTQPSAG